MAAFAWLSRLVGLALAGHVRQMPCFYWSRSARWAGHGGLDGLVARGIIRLWTDDLAGSRADFAEVIGREQVGEPFRLSQAVGFMGEAAFRMGLFDQAIEHTELAVSLATEAERAWELPMLHGLAALPRAARGGFRGGREPCRAGCSLGGGDGHARLRSPMPAPLAPSSLWHVMTPRLFTAPPSTSRTYAILANPVRIRSVQCWRSAGGIGPIRRGGFSA